MASDPKVEELRETWERAIGRDRPKDALVALEALSRLEPEEPQWSHRRGDVLRRLGRPKEAEIAFVRAVELYQARGFLARAAALAKAVMALNPARANLLAELDATSAKRLRDDHRAPKGSPLNPRMPGPPRLPSGTMQGIRLPPSPGIHISAMPREEAPTKPQGRALIDAERTKMRDHTDDVDDDDDDERGERPTLVAGVRAERVSVVASAMSLEHAKDAGPDEVRFENVPEVFAIDVDVDVSELESPTADTGSPDVEVAAFGEEAPTAVRLALMSASTLFTDVPKNVMGDLVAGAELLDVAHGAFLYRAGEEANGLYVLVEGKVDLVPAGSNRKIVVTEGTVFGEDALLQDAARNADARVNGRLLALRIPKTTLDRIVKRHASLGDVLFNILVRRLVTVALQVSPLFAAFDVPTRKELARLFEVRRAGAHVVIKERGKRGDGLYLALAGEFEVEEADGKKALLPLGTIFGQSSLVGGAAETRTVRVLKESVVLRLSAARFLGFAARLPSALAHVTELSKEPNAL